MANLLAEAGDIRIIGGGKDLLSEVIYWGSSTRKEKCIYSHTELGAGKRVNPISGQENTLTYGAEVVEKFRYQTDSTHVRLYGWATPQLQKIAAEVVDDLIPRFDDKIYAIWQYPFFLWKKICNMVDAPRRWAIHQWFNGNYICTADTNITIREVAAKAGFEVSYPWSTGALTPLDIVHICDELVSKGKMILKENV